MTVEEIKGSGNEIDRFPIGMRVLAVDDDPTCLKLLDGLLRKCQYQVTTTNQAVTALQMLRENRNRFDVVISDVHMPDMDGFKLLELVGLEMDLPVIMLSANSDPKLVMKGITHGACDYLVKPVRLEELRNIWQHVIRKKVETKTQTKSNNNQEKHENGQETGSGDPNAKLNRKRKDEDEEYEDNGNEDDESSTQKKPRVVWSIDLHRKFVAAVNQLGIEKAVPKRILDLMNVEGLTRENVASHLQKYRLYLKRISQQANMVVAFGGSKDAASYMRSLEGFSDFRSLSNPRRIPNTPLSSYSPSGMLGRLNSPNGVTIHNQNLTGTVSSLNKFQPVLLNPQNHPNPNHFPTFSGNTHLPDFSPVEDSRIFNGVSSSFSTLGSHSSMNLASSSSTFLDVPPPIGENFHHQLPPNTAVKYGFTAVTAASVPQESQSQSQSQSLNQSQRIGQYGKQGYGQYSSNGFNTLAAAPPQPPPPSASGGGLGGPVSQTNDQICGAYNRSNGNGGLPVQWNRDGKMPTGFVANNGYDSLDDLMNGMMKREPEPTITMDGEYGFDPYSFGSCL